MVLLWRIQGPDIEDEVQMGVIPRRRQIWIFPLIKGVIVGFMLGWFGLFLTALTMSLPQHGRCPSLPRRCWNFATTEAADYIEFVVKVAIVEIYNERLPVMGFHKSCDHVHVFCHGHVRFCPIFPGIRDLLDPKKDNLKIHEDKAALATSTTLEPFFRWNDIATMPCKWSRPEVSSSERSLRPMWGLVPTRHLKINAFECWIADSLLTTYPLDFLITMLELPQLIRSTLHQCMRSEQEIFDIMCLG